MRVKVHRTHALTTWFRLPENVECFLVEDDNNRYLMTGKFKDEGKGLGLTFTPINILVVNETEGDFFHVTMAHCDPKFIEGIERCLEATIPPVELSSDLDSS